MVVPIRIDRKFSEPPATLYFMSNNSNRYRFFTRKAGKLEVHQHYLGKCIDIVHAPRPTHAGAELRDD